MPSRKHSWGVLLAGALGLSTAGIAVAPIAAQAAPPIVIGGTISETGPLATDGAYQIKGIELAIADANKAGGWLGRKLELKIYDDKSSAGTAVRLYERLITDDRVNLLIGPYSSLVTVGIAPLINKYKMATIEPGASDPSIYVAGNEWNLQGTASSIRYLDQLLPAAKAQGATTVALLGLESAFTLACYHARVAQAKELGMKIVYQTTYSLPLPSFASIALAIKNAHPDVVEACTYYPDAVGLTRALHEQGFAPKYLAETVGPVEAPYLKALGPLANRVITNTGWWTNFKTPGNDAFIAGYKAMFHQDPEYHAATGYAAIQALGAAVEGTHSLDQAKIRAWLLANEVPTIQGTFKVNANGLALGYAQDLLQIQDGVLKLVYPEADAEAKLLVPYTGS
ncbi:MAG TPA: amino acid ABC transporter substrate-binding protein [Acetobacteraceae bacterium]|nr:amino acid ABC transporter substrate-binding protein [Acetobacteraceae bacterium]